MRRHENPARVHPSTTHWQRVARHPTRMEWLTFRILTSWETVLLLQLAVAALAALR